MDSFFKRRRPPKSFRTKQSEKLQDGTKNKNIKAQRQGIQEDLLDGLKEKQPEPKKQAELNRSQSKLSSYTPAEKDTENLSEPFDFPEPDLPLYREENPEEDPDYLKQLEYEQGVQDFKIFQSIETIEKFAKYLIKSSHIKSLYNDLSSLTKKLRVIADKIQTLSGENSSDQDADTSLTELNLLFDKTRAEIDSKLQQLYAEQGKESELEDVFEWEMPDISGEETCSQQSLSFYLSDSDAFSEGVPDTTKPECSEIDGDESDDTQDHNIKTQRIADYNKKAQYKEQDRTKVLRNKGLTYAFNAFRISSENQTAKSATKSKTSKQVGSEPCREKGLNTAFNFYHNPASNKQKNKACFSTRHDSNQKKPQKNIQECIETMTKRRIYCR